MKFLTFLFFIINSFTIYSQKIITLKKNNFISIDKTITDVNVNKWIRSLNNITTKNIYIYISSNGGSVEAGELLIGQINYKKFYNFTIECIAQKAYSMAFHILQSCDKRYITQSSTVMQHQISLGIPNSQLENIISYLEMIKQMRDILELSTAKRINITIEDYRAKIITDWWLYGENIIKNNVADEIVYIGCEKELYNLTQVVTYKEFSLDKFDYIEKSKTIDLCPI